MTDQGPGHDAIPVPLLWVGIDEQPVLMANQFQGQVQQDEIILSFGTLVEPPIVGSTPEERRAQVLRVAYVPVRPIVRVTLTRRRLEELQTMLRDTIAIYERRYGVGE